MKLLKKEEIDILKTSTLPAIESKIAMRNSIDNEYNKQLLAVNLSLEKTKNSNASLSALDLMSKRDLEDKIVENRLAIIELNENKERISGVIFPQLKRDLLKLTTVDLIELEERKSLIKLSLQPHNFKNTKVIGKIMISDYPIKPKKRLIVVVAFVTGLILSIFLVFFMEFIRGAKEEDAKSSN